MRPSLPQVLATSGLRTLIVIGFAALLTMTIWICLVVGTVLVLRPALGTAGALFAVGGGLAVLVILVIAALSAFRTKTPTRQTVIRDEAIDIAMAALQSRRGRQLALGTLGALLLAAAALMPASAKTDSK